MIRNSKLLRSTLTRVRPPGGVVRRRKAISSGLHILLMLACATAIQLPSNAQAQRAAIVQNNDGVARSPYKEAASNSTPCLPTSTFSCGVGFSAVPAGRRRVVETVSCLIRTNAPTSFPSMAYGGANGSSSIIYMVPVLTATVGGVSYYVANLQSVDAASEASESSFVIALPTSATVTGFNCTLLGYQITL